MGKVIAITGGTSGIGTETIRGLTDVVDKFILLARDGSKANDLISTLNVEAEFMELDLLDIASVSKASKSILENYSHIDVLINNAGGMFSKRQVTDIETEYTFTMNHLGHFALTIPLLPLLMKGEGKVINVSSEAHRMAKFDLDDLAMEKSFSSFRAYCNAKLCNVLFSNELNKRYYDRGVSAFSLHPGVVGTNFGSGLGGFLNTIYKLFKPLMLTPKQGAATSIYLAKSDDLYSESGNFFEKCKRSRATLPANHEELSELLWQRSEELISSFANQKSVEEPATTDV